MKCQFECSLTPAEQQRLRASLQKLSEAAASMGMKEDPTWLVCEVGDDGTLLKYYITECDYPVEFWGESVEHLAEQVEETAHLLQPANGFGEE